MPEIDDTIKTLIVKGHAQFLSPQEIIQTVKKTYGAEVSNQQVYAYSPSSPKCADKWKKLHGELRARFLRRIDEIPIANPVFQLQALQDAYDRLTANRTNINEVEVRNTIIAAWKLMQILELKNARSR
jgi:hypothetical protein